MMTTILLGMMLAVSAVESPRWINIAPLAADHAVETAADQRWLYANTIVDSTAFMATLVPEGEPVFDKAAVYAERFGAMKSLLADAEGKVGILFQATMGHGWVPDSPASFPRLVSADGSSPYIFCPLDSGFLAYIRSAAARLAACRPDFFMVDDDTRHITGRGGCYCPLHIAEMERRTGRSFTREELARAVREDREIAAVYDQLLSDSIAGLVTVIREEMDRVDPAIPGSFCCCFWDAHHAGRMARLLAAPDQTPVVRLNNGRYLREDARDIPYWLHNTALELATIPDDIIVLDEPDTCPQNQYSMSAKDLNAHITLALLEGCEGGKIWITRLSDHEPASGAAYRSIFAERRGFYERLLELAPEWDGVKIPFPQRLPAPTLTGRGLENWGGTAFGRFGIPYTSTVVDRHLAALSGDDVAALSDEDIRSLLARKAIVSGEGAVALTARGFGELIGCQARTWDGPVASFERLADGRRINSLVWAKRLDEIAPEAEILSTLWHRSAELASDATEVGIGSYRYRNASGGEVVVFACDLPDNLSLDAFSFYNETRKRQIIDALSRLSGGETDFPYYPGTNEIMLRWGRAKDGTRLLAATNLGHDDLPALELVFPKGLMPNGIRHLAADGTWAEVDFTCTEDGRVILSTRLNFLDPAVFAIEYPKNH